MIASFHDLIPEIGTQTRYWFIRTEGGALFNAFIASGSVAIGYSRVKLDAIQELTGDAIGDQVKALIKTLYPEKKSPGFAAYQVLTLTKTIKNGDYVIIPSHGTSRIAIGQITDDAAFEEVLTSGGNTYDDFKIRRRVRWIAQYNRTDVHPQVWRILQTHQTIVDATELAPWIDPLLFDIYKKGNEYFYSIKIEKREHINGQILFKACLGLFSAADDFAQREGIDSDASEVDVKINLNSPGKIQFIAKKAATVGIIAILVVMLNGGSVDINIEAINLRATIGSPGIIRTVNTFLNDSAKRDAMAALTAKIQELEISDSAQVESMIRTVTEAESSIAPDYSLPASTSTVEDAPEQQQQLESE